MSKAIKFLQAVHIAGKDYAHNSVHALSDELIAHPYFQKLVNSGLVVEAEAVQIITPASIEERQKALADFIAKKGAAKKAKAESQKPEGGEAPPAPEGSGEQAPEGSESGEQSHGEEHGEESESAEGDESETEHKGHAKKSKKHKR
jgi:hypothetical protein